MGLLKTGEHGFEVRQWRMPQGCQVGMHKNKGGEEEKLQHVNGINNLDPAEQFDIIFKLFDAPQKEAGDHLGR